MSLEIISGAYAAGEVKTYMISGERFEILDAPNPVDVVLLDRSGVQTAIMKGAEASFYVEPSEGFECVQITSPVAQTVRCFIGSGDSGTRRAAGVVTLNSASVVTLLGDPLARSLAGQSFSLCIFDGGGPGKPGLQLVNPAGSGKTVVIRGLELWGEANSIVYGGRRDATIGSSAGNGQNKNLGGAVSAAVAYTDYTLTSYVTTLFEQIPLGPTASVRTSKTYMEPIILLPGRGYCWEGKTGSLADLTANIEFEEF